MKAIPIKDGLNEIKVAQHIFFRRVRGTVNQCCSYCGKEMKVGKIGMSSSKAGRYNTWIHTRCIPLFLRDVKREFDNNKRMFVAEDL